MNSEYEYSSHSGSTSITLKYNNATVDTQNKKVDIEWNYENNGTLEISFDSVVFSNTKFNSVFQKFSSSETVIDIEGTAIFTFSAGPYSCIIDAEDDLSLENPKDNWLFRL